MSLIKFNHNGYSYDDVVFRVDNEHIFESLYHYVAFLAESGNDIEYVKDIDDGEQ